MNAIINKRHLFKKMQSMRTHRMPMTMPFFGHLKVTLGTFDAPIMRGLSIVIVETGCTTDVAKIIVPFDGMQSTSIWTSFLTSFSTSAVTNMVLLDNPIRPFSEEQSIVGFPICKMAKVHIRSFLQIKPKGICLSVTHIIWSQSIHIWQQRRGLSNRIDERIKRHQNWSNWCTPFCH